VTRTTRLLGALVAVVSVAGTALTSLAAPSGHPQEQRPEYRVSVEVVRLHTTVLDGDGNPVTGLTARDFVVIDNGVAHDVALALSPGDTPIDVALVFDQSDSIRQQAPTVKRDARAFLDALGPDDCAFVPFQHRIGPGIWGPPVDPSLLQIIDLTRLEGGTSFNDALMVGLAEVQQWNVPGVLAARVETEYQQPTISGGVGINLGPPQEPVDEPDPEGAGFRRADLPFRVFDANFGCGASSAPGGGPSPDRRKALVVLSDGVDTTSAHTFGELLGFVHQTAVPIFSVGIGLLGRGVEASGRDAQRAARLAKSRLETLAKSTSGKYIEGSGSGTRLRDAYDEIVTMLRGSYLLGYYPQNRDESTQAQTHEHAIEVKLRRPGLRVFARSEYYRAGRDTHAARSAPPQDVEARLNVPRVFVEGPRSDDPGRYVRLAALVRALSRAVSDSPLLGLVRFPLDADYFLYIEAEDPDRRRPAALESRLELYNYADRRLWREDMDIDDLTSEQAIAEAVRRALAELEDWLARER
jgi:hypothetical protein